MYRYESTEPQRGAIGKRAGKPEGIGRAQDGGFQAKATGTPRAGVRGTGDALNAPGLHPAIKGCVDRTFHPHLYAGPGLDHLHAA